MDDGTSPPKRSVTPAAMPIRFLALERKNPVDRMSSSRPRGARAASASGVGYAANRPTA